MSPSPNAYLVAPEFGTPDVSFDLTTWIEAAATVPRTTGVLAFINGLWFCSGSPDGLSDMFGLWVSTNGVQWSKVIGNAGDLRFGDVIWTGSHYFASGATFSDFTLKVYRSTDGFTWTQLITGFESRETQFPNMAGSGSNWVLWDADWGGGGRPFPLYSHDGGATWSEGTFSNPDLFITGGVCVLHNAAGWILVAHAQEEGLPDAAPENTFLMHSSDGVTWDEQNLYDAIGVIGVFTGGVFEGDFHLVLVSSSHNLVMYRSSTLTGWTVHGLPPEFVPVMLREWNSKFFGFLEVDPPGVYESDDGSTWTRVLAGEFGTGYLAYGPYGLVPQRQFPRDDGLAISTRRSWPPNISQQYGLRRGTVNTYQ